MGQRNKNGRMDNLCPRISDDEIKTTATSPKRHSEPNGSELYQKMSPCGPAREAQGPQGLEGDSPKRVA